MQTQALHSSRESREGVKFLSEVPSSWHTFPKLPIRNLYPMQVTNIRHQRDHLRFIMGAIEREGKEVKSGPSWDRGI